ncbi:BnaA05g34630D [Brassica napus]|uniref:BnaA05g34630D protein n=1 Tax=Brassica napus TaxID=3708 RepID=A0A078IRB9_BRANA|nr:BnaA05g34630D [Brassica napus]
MAVSSLSIRYCLSPTISQKTDIHCPNPSLRASCSLSSGYNLDSSENTYQKGSGSSWKRRQALVGVGTLLATSVPATLLLAEGNLPKTVPKSYSAFVDKEDGYSYYYPSDWREFDFRAHDSAFKDRYLQLQSVRVRFIPTEKTDIREVGPMDEVVYDLVKHKFAAPNQVATIYDMKERVEDGRSYYTFEYGLRTPIYATTCFATVAVGNNRYYTLIVGANERRWRKVKKQLEVVADSLKILQI